VTAERYDFIASRPVHRVRGETVREAQRVVTPVEAWERYAEKSRPRRETNAAGARTWINWTQYPDHGPDESVLGDVTGKTVLELGSGTGANIAHLATLGARCVGVDLAPSRKDAADQAWGGRANLDFVTADVVDYLASTPARFDVVYSIFGAVWFTDPEILLPLVRARMAAGGVFVFTQLPATGQPSAAPDRVIRKWDHSAEQWMHVLSDQGFDSVTAEVIDPPVPCRLGTLFVRALNV
jgi:SAM-dependent methyltransferase